jgi:DNA-binding winged helix-turn-helix (wHTH) protein
MRFASPPQPAGPSADVRFTGYRFGRCVIDRDARELFYDGAPRPIAPKPFDVLLHLLDHCWRVVSREELRDALWPGAIVTDNAVARAVMKARIAIGDCDADSSQIRTVNRVGYRFAALHTGLTTRPARSADGRADPAGSPPSHAPAATAPENDEHPH